MWLPILYSADAKPIDESDQPLLQGHFVEMLNADEAIIVDDQGHLSPIETIRIRFPDGILGPRETLTFEE